MCEGVMVAGVDRRQTMSDREIHTVMVVAGRVCGGVVSTGTPMPTDGLPDLIGCEMGHEWHNFNPFRTPGDPCDAVLGARRRCWGTLVAVSPFPVTVGIWEEIDLCTAPVCEGNGCPTNCESAGAIVATVSVTGPSHRPNECRLDCPCKGWCGATPAFCSPDAAPDGRHTPCGEVEVLDVPIPCERPLVALTPTLPGHEDCGCGATLEPADWWVPTEDTM